MVGIFGGLSSIGLQNQLNMVWGKGFRVAAAPPPPKHLQSNPPPPPPPEHSSYGIFHRLCPPALESIIQQIKLSRTYAALKKMDFNICL